LLVKEVQSEHPEVLETALAAFGASKLDFVDCLLASYSKHLLQLFLGPAPTLSLDRCTGGMSIVSPDKQFAADIFAERDEIVAKMKFASGPGPTFSSFGAYYTKRDNAMW
jgi:hypothetical protein